MVESSLTVTVYGDVLTGFLDIHFFREIVTYKQRFSYLDGNASL